MLNEKCFFIWRLPILYRIYVTHPSVIPHILKYGYIIIIPVLCVANVHYTSHCWIQRYYNPLLEINNFGLASKNDPITHTLNFTYRSLTCTSCTFENFLMSAVFPLLPHKPIVRYIDFITTSPTSLKQFSSHVYKCWPTSIDLCCKEKITCLWLYVVWVRANMHDPVDLNWYIIRLLFHAAGHYNGSSVYRVSCWAFDNHRTSDIFGMPNGLMDLCNTGKEGEGLSLK